MKQITKDMGEFIYPSLFTVDLDLGFLDDSEIEESITSIQRGKHGNLFINFNMNKYVLKFLQGLYEKSCGDGKIVVNQSRKDGTIWSKRTYTGVKIQDHNRNSIISLFDSLSYNSAEPIKDIVLEFAYDGMTHKFAL